MPKQETIIGIKLHVAPMNFNFFEVWQEKKIVFDENENEETVKENIDKAKQTVVNECIESAIEVFNRTEMKFDLNHLVSRILDSYDKGLNKQEINLSIDDIIMSNKKESKTPIIKEPKKKEEPGLLSSLASLKKIVRESDENAPIGFVLPKSANDDDPSNDIPSGIIEHDFKIG